MSIDSYSRTNSLYCTYLYIFTSVLINGTILYPCGSILSSAKLNSFMLIHISDSSDLLCIHAPGHQKDGCTLSLAVHPHWMYSKPCCTSMFLLLIPNIHSADFTSIYYQAQGCHMQQGQLSITAKMDIWTRTTDSGPPRLLTWPSRAPTAGSGQLRL